jgi:hypothetical protein
MASHPALNSHQADTSLQPTPGPNSFLNKGVPMVAQPAPHIAKLKDLSDFNAQRIAAYPELF